MLETLKRLTLFPYSKPMAPTLTKNDVRAWLGQKEIDKGRPYAQRGALLRLRVQEGVIKGDCLGNSPRPYRVEATLKNGTIQRANCSCPVGDGGHCKHTAALLLTWIDFPELFTEVEALKASLEAYSKDNLIALVGKMIERYPDLETLVETSAPDFTEKPVSASAIQAQVRGVIGNYERDYGWDGYGGSHSQNELDDLTHVADRYLESGQLNSAATAYKTIADEVLRDYHELEDEEGGLASVAQNCAEGLIKCLAKADKEEENLREIILTSLFELYCEDLDLGGYGISDGIPEAIVEYATLEERQEVARWVEGAIPKDDGWSKRFQREYLGQFLLQLQADTLDDETFLRISRETGRLEDLVVRLLELNRLDDAVQEVKSAEDYRLLRLTDLFIEAGHVDTAYELVLERSKKSDDNRLLEWLKTWHERRSEFKEAFEYSATLFWRRPSIEPYKEMRRLGEHTVAWRAKRETVLTVLNQREHYALLTEIYLLHGAVDAALGSLALLKRIGRSSKQLNLAVARAAERSRPEEAIRLYRAEIDRLIEARGRRSYAEAAQHLLRVQELYDILGQIDEWERYVRGLRERHKQLRALKDEMDKVGVEPRA